MSQTLSSQAGGDLISQTASRPETAGHAADVSEERLWAVSLRYLQRVSASTKMLLQVLDRRLHRAIAAGLLTPEEAVKRRDAVADRAVRCGYLDDIRFAQGRVASLLRRGKSPRLIVEILKSQGIAEEIAASTLTSIPDARTEEIAFLAARAYAKRRRLGPFRKDLAAPRPIEKDLAALLRAGHSFAVSHRVLTAEDEA